MKKLQSRIKECDKSFQGEKSNGIPLIAHAQAGGNDAIQVYEYLKSLSSQKTTARVF